MKKIILFLFFIKMIFPSQVNADWVQITSYPAPNAQEIVEKNGVLYAGAYNNGVYISYNNGASWEQRNNGLNVSYSKWIQCILPNSSGLYIATYDGIYKSTNDGITWEPKNNGIQIGPGATYIFAYSLFEDNGVLYTGTYNSIYKSTDEGENWTPTTAITGHLDICTFHKYNNMILAGTQAGNRLPIMYSTNNGDNWATMQIWNNFPTSAFSIYSEPGKIFAGTAMGMWLSTNNGVNWIQREAGLGADPYVFALIKVGNTLFAGTNAWIYKTTNDGVNWEQTTFSGQTFQDVNKLMVYNNKMYVAAYTGLWYRNIEEIVTGVENPAQIPDEFRLSQNYPNPFNPATKIEYSLPKNSNVLLKIYDYTGREIQTLVNEMKSAGSYSVDFNASSLSSGVYFYKLEADGLTFTKKMTVVK